MPIKPKIKTLTNSSVDILNAIRNEASTNYRDYVPVATPDADSIKAIGNVLMDYPNLQNEFIPALLNRIGRVVVTNKTYDNPWAMFKKGMLDFGETIEEVFVDIARAFQYDPAVAETHFMKREIPAVRSAFHILNYKHFYKATIQQNDLRQAFLSWDGVNDLIAKITEAMYTAANYDEFQTMKYMLALHILRGQIYPVTIEEPTSANASAIVTAVKGASNMLTFMSRKYNLAGVANYTDKRDQIILINSAFDATMDVNVLATAFNMDRAEFMGQRVLVDGFGDLDIERLNELFKDDSTYYEISQDELDALNEIPIVVVDRNWFMIFDNTVQFTENFNGEGIYWQYWYHVWKTFSVSPFANAIAFVPDESRVTTITVTPDTATVAKGSTLALVVNVETQGFAPQTVTYSSDNENVTVSASGIVTIGEEASGTATITVKSVYTPEVEKTVTLTIS